MSANNRNRLKTTVSAVASSGLGAFTISTASSGYRTFVSGDDGLTFDGVLITEGTAWEVRDGCVYTHSGTSLSRGTLMDSSTGSAIAFTSAAVVSQGAAKMFADMAQLAMAAVMPGGRLTLESGMHVSTTDQIAKTSIYYTPSVGNVVPLWDGYKWRPIEFSETTLALGTLTSGKPYDVFGYISGGALALESLAWTNDTTRATAVTLQDGRYCKSGDKTRLLLGTFYTTSTTTTEDSASNRYLANVYNQILRTLEKTDATSHTYATATQRPWNNDTNLRVGFISTNGLISVPIRLRCNMYPSTVGNFTRNVVALDSITSGVYANAVVTAWNSSGTTAFANEVVPNSAISAGRHYLQIMENADSSATVNFTNVSLQGMIPC